VQGLKMLDDSSKCHVQAGESFVNVSLLGTIKGTMGRLSKKVMCG
jgi:hypothetical protein